ncbi:MAG: asparaginase [bacterium]|nr:asparaginase [bacterium]
MSKKPKPRICLIYTGGTIGMIETPDGLRPPENPSDFLKIAPELKELVEIEFVELLNKDSTNMNPSDWEKMARAVYERRNNGYKGFVIAHGTDTMHFSSSALAFAFGRNLNFPIVFTGAQTTPRILHGDARINLVRACRVALEPLAEVVISFGDFVFRGCRAQKKDERKFDAFESPAFPPLAYITERIDMQPIARKKRNGGRGEIEFRPYFEKGILQVALIPGLEPKLLQPAIESGDCRGIILQSFGAGNVPDEAGYSFIPIIKEMVEIQKKPTIITSQFPAGSTLDSPYAPGKAAVDAGAIPTGNMTYAAATAKFRWVLALVKEEMKKGEVSPSNKINQIRKRMTENIIGEVGPVEPID